MMERGRSSRISGRRKRRFFTDVAPYTLVACIVSYWAMSSGLPVTCGAPDALLSEPSTPAGRRARPSERMARQRGRPEAAPHSRRGVGSVVAQAPDQGVVPCLGHADPRTLPHAHVAVVTRVPLDGVEMR